ncbi:MAG: hypothetical protein JY451_09770 [Erythrobacter sp.]|nr:MAG: hypothetical protein JY451_09770 [Erythrobacter sp.]
MRIVFLPLIFALLGGCGAEPTPAPAPTAVASPVEAEESPAVPVDTLAGEWRVAGIDGAEFNEAYGLALSASEDEIWWEPRCAGMVRSYAIDGLEFSASPLAAEAPAPDSPPPPVCAIAVPPRLADVARALDQAEQIARTPSNGILISGGRHDLLLFSQ